MSKLWIVHRRPEMRAALARSSGLPAGEIVEGDPVAREAFAAAPPPAAVLLGLEQDFEHELEFAHRERERLRHARWIVLCDRGDADEARRLFDLAHPEILTHPLDPRALRARIAEARGVRRVESLTQRLQRERIAARFSTWLGGLEVPGLLRALDPALAALPLLVRGVPGSGRALLGRYVELFRGARGRTLRLDTGTLGDIEEIPQRLAAAGAGPTTIWLDDVDALPGAAQRALAEWIRHDAPPAVSPVPGLRWIATAGPDDLFSSLESALERAFAPLVLDVPALADHPECLGRFAEGIAQDWSREVGGPARRFSPEAIEALGRLRWSGDRAEIEAVLRSSLAGSSREVLEAGDLRFPAGGPLPRPTAAAPQPVAPEPEPVTPEPVAPEPVAPEPEPGSAAGREAVAEAGLTSGPEVRPIVEAEEGSGAFEDRLEAVLTPGEDVPATAARPAPGEGMAELERVFAEGGGRLEADAPPGSEAGPADAVEPDDFDESARLTAAAFEAAEGPDSAELATAVPGSSAAARGEPTGRDASDLREPQREARAPAGAEPPESPAAAGDLGWRRLARSLSHEIRNPLVSIRTFAELLPEHFEDATFRARFTDLVGKDVAHIDEVLSRLSSVAEQERLEVEPVDVSAMLEQLLEERRERIGRRRLLVLRELERETPFALADAHSLRVALAGLLDRALESLPERGDLFVATRHVERSADGSPRLRVLLRHHNPELARDAATAFAELDPTANLIEYVLAETVIEASGGRLTIDATDALETLILVDLRTPD